MNRKIKNMLAIIIIFISFFVIISVVINLGEKLVMYYELKTEIKVINKNITNLENEITKINDPEYQQKYYREEFLLSEENELLFILE